MAPSKKKRTHTVFRDSSAHRSASTSKPRFVGECRHVKLNEICSKGKSSLRQKDVINDGPYSVYGASGVVGTTSDYQNEIPYVAVIKDGAGVGRASACEPMTSVLGTMQALIPNPNVERDYLLYLVRSLRLGEGFSGSTIPHIYFKDYGKIEVPLPSLEAQKRIVSQLGLIEAQIEQAEAQTTQLDQLVKSRFIEMFGDPCDPKSEKERSRIDSFCELRIGPFGSALHKEDYISNGHPLVNPSHIVNGAVRPDWDLTINDAKYESLAAYQLFPGDVVLGRRGEIGRCAVVDKDGMICGTGSMILRPDRKVRSDYLQRVVSFPSFRRALENNAVGVTMKNLNAKIVGSAEVYLPKLKDQDAFAAFVHQVDKSRFVRDHEINFRWERFTLSWSTIA